MHIDLTLKNNVQSTEFFSFRIRVPTLVRERLQNSFRSLPLPRSSNDRDMRERRLRFRGRNVTLTKGCQLVSGCVKCVRSQIGPGSAPFPSPLRPSLPPTGSRGRRPYRVFKRPPTLPAMRSCKESWRAGCSDSERQSGIGLAGGIFPVRV